MVETNDVRGRILREATRLFAEAGFDATPIQTVAEAAGIRRPTLVYHFGSKEQLRQEVLDTVVAHWKNELPGILTAATRGTGDRLDTVMGRLMAFFVADRNRARLLIREMLDRPEEIRTLFATHLQPWTSLVTDAIARGQAAGTMKHDVSPACYAVEIVQMVLFTAAAGDIASTIMAGETRTVDELLSELVRIARASLFVSKTQDGD